VLEYALLVAIVALVVFLSLRLFGDAADGDAGGAADRNDSASAQTYCSGAASSWWVNSSARSAHAACDSVSGSKVV